MRLQEKSLGQLLLQAGRVTPDQLREALDVQARTGEPLGRVLVRLGYVEARDVHRALEGVAALTFRTGGEFFGFEAVRVREVVKAVPLKALPAARPEWEGFFTLRGRAVPVLSLRRVLALPDGGGEGGWFVLIERGRAPFAVRVDEVREVVRLKPEQLGPVPPYLLGRRPDLFVYLAKGPDGLTSLIDGDRLASVGDVPEVPEGGEVDHARPS